MGLLPRMLLVDAERINPEDLRHRFIAKIQKSGVQIASNRKRGRRIESDGHRIGGVTPDVGEGGVDGRGREVNDSGGGSDGGGLGAGEEGEEADMVLGEVEFVVVVGG